MTREQWAEELLNAGGWPVTKLAVTDIICWQNQENTKAKFNPLATTKPMPGSTMFNDLGNGQGVQNYTSAEQGLEATVKTLNNGYYPGILDALVAGGSGDFGLTVSQTQWGTGYFTVTGQSTKALTSPTADPNKYVTTASDKAPTLSDYPGLFIDNNGAYQINWSASTQAKIANMGILYLWDRQNSVISSVNNFNKESIKQAKLLGPTSPKYYQWVNSQMYDAYGPQGSTTTAGGANAGDLSLKDLSLKDIYIIIGVVLVGVLILILIARAIKPAAQAAAPLAALAV